MVKHWKLYGVTHFLAAKLTGNDFEMQTMKRRVTTSHARRVSWYSVHGSQ